MPSAAEFHGHCRVRSMRLMASSRAAGRLAPSSAAISSSLHFAVREPRDSFDQRQLLDGGKWRREQCGQLLPGYGAQECALAFEDAHAEQCHGLDAAFRGKTQRVFRFRVPQIGEGRRGAMPLAFSCVLQVCLPAWKRAIGE